MNDRDNLPAPRRDAGLPVASDGGYGWSGDSAEGVAEFNAFSPRRLLRAVLRYKWLVLALAVAGGTTALFATRFLELSYTAEARLWMQAVTRNDAAMGPIRSSELLQNDAWLELLRSNAVLDSAVMQEKLYVRYDRRDADVLAELEANEEALVPGTYTLRAGTDGGLELRTQEGHLIERVRGGEVVGSSIGLVWRPVFAQQDREVVFTLLSPRDAVGHLNRRLDARLARGGNFMWIS
jgi:hypothetical protein